MVPSSSHHDADKNQIGLFPSRDEGSRQEEPKRQAVGGSSSHPSWRWAEWRHGRGRPWHHPGEAGLMAGVLEGATAHATEMGMM